MTTAYITHPKYSEHDFPNHPEHPGRIQAIWQMLTHSGLVNRMKSLSPEPVTDEMIGTVHTPSYIETLNWLASQDNIIQFDSDTYAFPSSAEVARLAAGGVVRAVDAVMSGEADNALAAVRPPGHHALIGRGMGFCLLGNVPIAVRHAQKQYGITRVMVVDFDVHHGNGTQDMFYADDSVLFISTHQSPFYPGTGLIHETGTGQGKGYTLNIPLKPGHGDESFKLIYKEIIWKAAERFQPELIIVSAGFDAHWKDPLAMLQLSLEGYSLMTFELMRMAERFCDGKIIFAVEGGYDLGVLANGVRNIVHTLLGDDEVSDPFGKRPATASPDDILLLIEQLKKIHNL